MSDCIATRPETPTWAERGDEHTVVCKTCHIAYGEPFHFTISRGPRRGEKVSGLPRYCLVCRQEAAEAKRKSRPLDAALVGHVRAYALGHRDEGWDEVVTSFSDQDIWEVIVGLETPHEAVGEMARVVRRRNKYRERTGKRPLHNYDAMLIEIDADAAY
jgi:hypothetical protein